MPSWSPPAAEHVRYDWQPRITVGKLGVFHKGEVDIWSSFVKAQHQLCFARLWLCFAMPAMQPNRKRTQRVGGTHGWQGAPTV